MTEVGLGVHERIQPLARTVGVVVINNEGKILVVRHGSGARAKEGVNGFPAGHLEDGESEKQGAIRELSEETGLVAEEDDLIDFPGNRVSGLLQLKNGTEHASFAVFLCRKFKGELRDEPGISTPEWVDVKRLNVLYETMPNVAQLAVNAVNFANSQ